VAWVFFRAENLAQAWEIVVSLFAFDGTPMRIPDELIFSKALAVTILDCGREAYFGFGFNELRIGSAGFRSAVDRLILAGMILCCVFLRGPGTAFIYFQF